MNKLFRLTTVVLMAVTAITFSACKKNFDNPPGAADPAIVANTTIQALKAMHTTAGAYDVITSDIIISGVVVANDKSGNLYKQLYIQDATGGLQILLDANSLYGTYPVGRKIFIKCKDLCISDYNKTMELGIKATVGGLPSLEGIPANLISKYVMGGSLNNPVTPTPVTLAQLGGTSSTNMQDPYIGMLVQLDNFAFNNINATYSDTSVYKTTQNLDLKNCSGDAIIVRTSAYANFAGQRVAQGRGKLTAIYTVFGNTKQFIIRDTSDVAFTDPYACPLPPGTLFFENFESIGSNNAVLNIPGWKNIGEVGGVSYQNAVFGPVKCAKISAFNTGASTVTSWFISPVISLTGATAPKLTFLETAGFASGPTVLEVLVSTNYNGSNTPSSSTWTQVWSRTATSPTTGFGTLASVGNINLSAFIGQNVYIAFKYSGGDPSKTTTYEFDDVKVTAQ
ncbi:MAG: choice-of-anchor J domain-containing protein [Ferruginibacter sp.]|nr:choice-of-anchor J domain-containing protein [Bacteroidota bacterium]MBX2919084.1 choice-of-anchor J domain-containing protein [Ferruginibacter sp.]MCB0710249.1 choice-of-anchor J domain-containing protein [Chitinophagaceae bacterium]